MSGATIALLIGVVLFVGVTILLGLGAGFAIMGREPAVKDTRPRWKRGQTVDIEVTLVRSDRRDLACASSTEIAGKRCAFQAAGKPWSTVGNPGDDDQILRPYTTIDRVQLTAAGLWAEPAMAPDKLPLTRFTVKCKYEIEGKLPALSVRWEETGSWFPNTEWYAGSLTECAINP